MSTLALPTSAQPIEYPDSDGLPMAESTLQYDWIVKITGGLRRLFRGENVFVAGDLFWYPVEGRPDIRMAPDTLLAFGRPPGHRKSYMQWLEEGIAPQVVFEILSPSNRPGEMADKLAFYSRYGVQEYYLYDPDRVKLKGYQREGDELVEIKAMNGHVSPRLGMKFDIAAAELRLIGPDGLPLETYEEVTEEADEQRREAQEQRREAQEQRREAQEQRRRADQAELRARQLEAELERIRRNEK